MALSLPPDMPVALEIPMMRMQETVPPAQRARMAIAATLALLGKEGSR
ncbi:GGDEF domain-containing protein [Paracoccus yeei]|uniref:GGDEF domain-containing protein n=1 Tax=Paracoccus yeei TaxID=147645 RepID=A0A386ULI5_9RHOB|nr:GGDEF domain-containing protein [Paracoccus yeei]